MLLAMLMFLSIEKTPKIVILTVEILIFEAEQQGYRKDCYFPTEILT